MIFAARAVPPPHRVYQPVGRFRRRGDRHRVGPFVWGQVSIRRPWPTFDGRCAAIATRLVAWLAAADDRRDELGQILQLASGDPLGRVDVEDPGPPVRGPRWQRRDLPFASVRARRHPVPAPRRRDVTVRRARRGLGVRRPEAFPNAPTEQRRRTASRSGVVEAARAMTGRSHGAAMATRGRRHRRSQLKQSAGSIPVLGMQQSTVLTTPRATRWTRNNILVVLRSTSDRGAARPC
jgi:hypothetical protein